MSKQNFSKTSLELFGGAGGLALGVSKAGYQNKALVEYNHQSCETLRLNHQNGLEFIKDWNIIEGDVKEFDYSPFLGRIDLVTGGPPCQPFSLAGKHAAHNDARDMFPEAVRAVRELKPRAFIFENVKGLMRGTFSSYLSYIRLQLTYPSITIGENETWLEHLGRLEKTFTSGRHCEYLVVVRLLNAADYGVPQKRERVVFVGLKENLKVEWSFPTTTHSRTILLHDKWISGEYWDRHKVPKSQRGFKPVLSTSILELIEKDVEKNMLPWQTVRDSIGDLPKPSASESKIHSNHRLNPGARAYPGHTGSSLDEPAKTLKAGAHGVPGGENMLAYPGGKVRYLTVRESARLQTFPDSYTFPVSWTESMRQLGNAVPVDLGYAVAKSVDTLLVSKGA